MQHLNVRNNSLFFRRYIYYYYYYCCCGIDATIVLDC
jgi:hypothetical protein